MGLHLSQFLMKLPVSLISLLGIPLGNSGREPERRPGGHDQIVKFQFMFHATDCDSFWGHLHHLGMGEHQAIFQEIVVRDNDGRGQVGVNCGPEDGKREQEVVLALQDHHIEVIVQVLGQHGATKPASNDHHCRLFTRGRGRVSHVNNNNNNKQEGVEKETNLQALYLSFFFLEPAIVLKATKIM